MKKVEEDKINKSPFKTEKSNKQINNSYSYYDFHLWYLMWRTKDFQRNLDIQSSYSIYSFSDPNSLIFITQEL